MTTPASDPAPFEGFDWTTFWDDGEYALESFVEPPPTDDRIASVERELGYKLPASYVAMARIHNGGIPHKSCLPTSEPTSWAENHVAITGIFSIGREKSSSLCGRLGSAFMMEEWEYPDIGVYFATCPSAGHDMIALDYRACGRSGEPSVVHVDQEGDFCITPLAPDFESFIRGLVHESRFED